MDLTLHRWSYYSHDTRRWPNENHTPPIYWINVSLRYPLAELRKPFPTKPFILLSVKFLNHPVRLPKHMIIADSEPLSSANHDYQTETQKISVTRTVEAQRKSHANLQGSHTSEHIITLEAVVTVWYKSNKSSTTRMAQHTTVCYEKNKWLTQNWRNQIILPEKHEEYRKSFLNVLSKFEFMWDGVLGTISTARHLIELVNPTTTPVQSDPYLAGPKAREFEKTKIIEIFDDSTVETTWTEWASSVVFAPMKYGTLRFCVN